MPHALTLALDAAARERVGALWARLDAAGIGDPAHRAGHPPHLTLAVFEEAPEIDLAGIAPPRMIVATHPGVFVAPSRVLFLAPLVTPDLLAAQARAVAGHEVAAHWRPGAWVPHVTLAQGFADEAQALAALGTVALPFEMGVEAVELVVFPPARVIARHALA